MFVDFFKAFDSIKREKMEKILLAYGFPKETVTLLYKGTNATVRSHLLGDTDFFDIVWSEKIMYYERQLIL